MPAEQRLGLDEEPCLVTTAKEPARGGEQRPIAWPQRRASHPAAEHGHLVSEHDDICVLRDR